MPLDSESGCCIMCARFCEIQSILILVYFDIQRLFGAGGGVVLPILQEMPASRGGLLRREFVPSLVSNAVFLLSQVQAVSVSVVNFKGRPFMRGTSFPPLYDATFYCHTSLESHVLVPSPGGVVVDS